jgi:hypothetical protein
MPMVRIFLNFFKHRKNLMTTTRTLSCHAKLEIFVVMKIHVVVFRVVTPCSDMVDLENIAACIFSEK